MEMEIDEVGEKSLAKPDDAGNRNKMASSSSTPIDQEKSDEHELKIMEVEGAVTTDNTETIELVDDVADSASVNLVNESQDVPEAHEKPADDAQLEELSTKRERHSDGEGSYNGPDPMGLLEPIDSSKDVDVEDNEVDIDDSSDEVSSSDSRGVVRREHWPNWMKRYTWLLHETSDGSLAFCLYCNVVINVNKHLKNIQQHNISLYHQEREMNYLAFKNSDEQKRNRSHDVEVKHEFGTDSYVAAMKLKRAGDVEKLNNFNWQRWLSCHDWLERFQNEGTLGICKHCNIRMNVEFVYLRKRHESSKGHCEAQRSIGKQTRKRKHSDIQEDNIVVENNDKNNPTHIDDPNIMTVVVAGVESTDPSEMCEVLPDTNPPQCRCTICDCRMAITSFTRHLKTKMHCTNLTHHKRDQIMVNRGVFAKYAEEHSWLVADPRDESLAYCSVCCRRFMYGHSEIKRKNHENSEKHKGALAAASAALAEDEDEDQTEPEPSEVQSESDDGSDDDYIEEDDKLSTSRKSSVEQPEESTESRETESVVQHFSWLRYSKDRKVQLCKYCRVRFFNDSGKLRHEHSARHKKLVQQFKARKASQYKEARKQRKESADASNENEGNDNGDEEVQSVADSEAETIEDNGSEEPNPPKHAYKVAPKPEPSVPATMQGKVMVWKDRFPWLSYKRSEQRSNYGWCKLCEISVFLPSFKFASKHQRSSRHVRLRFERKRTGGHLNAKTASTSTAASGTLLTGEAKNKAAMAELQSKYDWLEPDANEENFCHCKICDTRLPIKVFFLRQHDGSRKHADQLERIRNQSAVSTPTARTVDQTPSVMLVDQDTDEALSVKSEGSTEGHPPSKRMRRSREVRRILRALRDSVGKRSEQPPERSQLDMAKDMICSSFDIVSRLRTLERENESREFPAQSTPHHNASLMASPTQTPRHTIDLFFESITQTMKSLPADLAAEGKAKIMQIVCDLELRGMQRNSPIQPASPSKEIPTVHKSITRHNTIDDGLDATPPRRSTTNQMTIDEIICVSPPCSPESNDSIITVEDLTAEQQQPAQSNSTHNNNATKLTDGTKSSNQRTTAVSNPSPPSTSVTVTTAAQRLNGHNKEVPITVRRLLPSSLQVAHVPDATNDSLRVVPINKLTTQNQANQGNVRNTSNVSAMMQRSGHSPNSIVINSPPNSSISVHAETSNGTSSGSGCSSPLYQVRKIRVNNGTTTNVITVRKQPQKLMNSQHQSTPQQPQPMSFTNSGVPLTQVQIQAQAQLQAQAQIRNLNQRTVVRSVPASKHTHQ